MMGFQNAGDQNGQHQCVEAAKFKKKKPFANSGEIAEKT